MKHISLLSLLFVLIFSCVSITDIVPAGPDTYRISGGDSAPGANGENLKTTLFKRASDYCDLQHKIFEPVSSSSENHRPFVGLANASLTFHCLSRVTATH